jgi:hypothetical protein
MSINAIKSLVSASGGFAKANRFDINFTPPALGLQNFDGVNDVTILCESVSIPGKQISSFEYPLNLTENEVKVPNGYILEDVTCSFNLPTNYRIKKMFDLWQNFVIRPDYLLNYVDDYERDVTIRQLDEKNKAVYTCILYGAYPITVNSIALGNASPDTISKFDVTFAYNKYLTF